MAVSKEHFIGLQMEQFLLVRILTSFLFFKTIFETIGEIISMGKGKTIVNGLKQHSKFPK